MDQHPIQWVAPSPLWPELAKPGNGSGALAFGVPAILRFTSDDFMPDFFNLLATDPRKLGEFRAVRETWRGKLTQPIIPTPKKVFALQLQRLGSTLRRAPGTGGKPQESDDAKALPNLKLYQPAHMRYYLVTACLTCQIAGLPDRTVDTGKQQRVSFVVRRFFGGNEYAWVKTPIGYAWQPVQTQTQTRNDLVLEGEERLPLFPATYQDDDQRSRRMFAGLVPVGKREAYLGAQQITAASNGQPAATSGLTARKILFRKQVIEPWKVLVKQMGPVGAASSLSIAPDLTTSISPTPPASTSLKVAREQAQVISWLLLLDFAKFLNQYLPSVWNQTNLTANSFQQKVVDALSVIRIGSNLESELKQKSTISTVAGSLGDALKQALASESAIESARTPYLRDVSNNDWPKFLFPLADANHPDEAPVLQFTALSPASSGDENDFVGEGVGEDQIPHQIDQLAVLVLRALAEYQPNGNSSQPDIPAAALTPADGLNGLFCLRCVYERPSCGPLHDDVVSDPTETFEMAGFFDPDAPARPIRIGLPIDTSPAGLRKFDKNTAFVMSDVLCGQVKRLKGMTFGDLVRSVLPWPFHQDLSAGDMQSCTDSGGMSIGTICSLSIPIITLCALFLLLIMVILLDLIFSWMPFFMICFPFPKPKKT